MRYGTEQLSVLYDRAARHARVNIGPTHFYITSFQNFPLNTKESHQIGTISLYDRALFFMECVILGPTKNVIAS